MPTDFSSTNDTNNTMSSATSPSSYTNLAQDFVHPTASGANAKNDAGATIIGVFNSRDHAEQAVNALRSQGFTSEEINIVSKKGSSHNASAKNTSDGFYDDDISDGALAGSALGGIGGLILSASALAIPGIGPIVAAGPIAAAIGGAAAGGLTGGLIDWGIPSASGQRYEQSVAQGNILAIIRTTSDKVQQAAQIMRQNNAQEVESH